MAPNGTMTYLTDTPDEGEGEPRLSPDGTRIAFLTATTKPGDPIIYSLGVMDRSGADRPPDQSSGRRSRGLPGHRPAPRSSSGLSRLRSVPICPGAAG